MVLALITTTNFESKFSPVTFTKIRLFFALQYMIDITLKRVPFQHLIWPIWVWVVQNWLRFATTHRTKLFWGTWREEEHRNMGRGWRGTAKERETEQPP